MLRFDNNKINFNTLPKFDRITLIKNLGFNTTLIYSVNNIKELKYALNKLHSTNISIRSEGGINSTCKRLLENFTKAHIDHGRPLHVISVDSNRFLDFALSTPCIFDARPLFIYNAISDPGYLAGAVYVKEREIIIELCKNCYVRDITHANNVDISGICSILNGKFVRCRIKTREVIEIINKVSQLPFTDVVVELSYYKRPVGYKKENVIIWDLGGVARWHYKNRILMKR